MLHVDSLFPMPQDLEGMVLHQCQVHWMVLVGSKEVESGPILWWLAKLVPWPSWVGDDAHNDLITHWFKLRISEEELSQLVYRWVGPIGKIHASACQGRMLPYFEWNLKNWVWKKNAVCMTAKCLNACASLLQCHGKCLFFVDASLNGFYKTKPKWL